MIYEILKMFFFLYIISCIQGCKSKLPEKKDTDTEIVAHFTLSDNRSMNSFKDSNHISKAANGIFDRKDTLKHFIDILSTVAKDTSNLKDDSSLKNDSSVISIANLKGRWCSLKDLEPKFSIQGSEIFYYDATANYKFHLAGGKIKIDFDDFQYVGYIKMIGKDTLLMWNSKSSRKRIDTLHRCR